jgi:hypothetical protein
LLRLGQGQGPSRPGLQPPASWRWQVVATSRFGEQFRAAPVTSARDTTTEKEKESGDEP